MTFQIKWLPGLFNALPALYNVLLLQTTLSNTGKRQKIIIKILNSRLLVQLEKVRREKSIEEDSESWNVATRNEMLIIWNAKRNMKINIFINHLNEDTSWNKKILINLKKQTNTYVWIFFVYNFSEIPYLHMAVCQLDYYCLLSACCT